MALTSRQQARIQGMASRPGFRLGGIIEVIVNGRKYDARGAWSYGLGTVKRTAHVGPDGAIHGFTETPQPGFIEGEISDRHDLSMKEIANTVDATVVLSLANEKVIVLRHAAYVGDATGKTEDGSFSCRFEGGAEELRNGAAVNQPDAGD